MALDGITISNIVWELKEKALDGRIDKIYQPEKDEIILAIRGRGTNYKLLLTANPSHPRLHFTGQSKTNPLQAPLFCMVLRKHIMGGRLVKVLQPDFERIAELHIEALNEMGDRTIKRLVIEIMGKHSNIILVDESGVILDAVKHISHEKSSVREVLPGKAYSTPPSQDKKNPLLLNKEEFLQLVEMKKNQKLQALLYQSYSGISPVMASEICCRAAADPGALVEKNTPDILEGIYHHFETAMGQVRDGRYQCFIYYEGNKPFEFSCLPYFMLETCKKISFDSVSELLEAFYKEKDSLYRMGQKTADLRKLVSLSLERCVKKKELHLRTLAEIRDRDTLKIYGELITAYIHSIQKGMTVFACQNFYDEAGQEIKIPLDANLTPSENAQRYFKKYNKEKRTYAALQEQMKQNEQEISYLESVLTSLSISLEENDVEEIRQELFEQGFVKKRSTGGKKQKKPHQTTPLHYVSTDGFDMYVGKNNKQNDELTFRLASPQDLWLHTKDIPGSHVIVKLNSTPVPEATLMEAANLAAFYSKARLGSQVPVDYTLRKNVKKPNGAKPGFVIYEANQTLYIKPSEADIITRLP